jgi:hypothetical protein
MRASRRCMAIIAAYTLLFSQTFAARQSTSGTLKIPDGTIVRLSLLDALSSETNKVDDPVNLEVTEDVKVGDVVALPRGVAARGHVVEVEPKKRLGRAGKLDFTVDYVKAPDGSNLRLRASSARKGQDKSGTVIVGTVLLSGLFLLMHGKDVEIPKGTAFNAYVDGDREVALGGHPGAPQTTTEVPSHPVAPSPTGAGPTIVLVDPSVTDSGETVDVTTSTLTIRGVVTDPSGIPVVTINANPTSLRPKGPQAAAFMSDPIKLRSGENVFEIVATDAAHVQARMTFVARYTPSVVVPVQTVPQSNGKGLAKAEIVSLLQGGVSSARVTEIVEQRGISFVPTGDDIKEVRSAGGGDDLANGLTKAKLRR